MTACLAAGVRNNEKAGEGIISLFKPLGRVPGRSRITKVIEYLDCRLRMLTRHKRS